jgi:hypothetical protein
MEESGGKMLQCSQPPTIMSSQTLPSTNTAKTPLPLSETLRDLALLRASDVDLSGPLADALKRSQTTTNASKGSETAPEVNESVERSYEFASEARKAVRMLHRGAVDDQGARVEQVRAELEELTHGIDGSAT